MNTKKKRSLSDYADDIQPGGYDESTNPSNGWRAPDEPPAQYGLMGQRINSTEGNDDEPLCTIYNGVYTLENKETGTHRTLKVYTATGGKLKGKRLLAVLMGSNNETDYTAFAFVRDDEKGFKVWRRFTHAKGIHNKYAAILATLLLHDDSTWHRKVTLKTARNCIRCNRLLTTPQSITRGIGPECIKIVNGK